MRYDCTLHVTTDQVESFHLELRKWAPGSPLELNVPTGQKLNGRIVELNAVNGHVQLILETPSHDVEPSI